MNRPNPDGKERAQRAHELRVRQSEEQRQQTHSDIQANGGPLGRANRDRSAGPVSYTHLTLPTICSV